MDVEALIKRHPQLYHMAEAGSWEQVRRDGLLSTTAILDLYEVHGKQRHLIESSRRPRSVKLVHPRTGETVVIRDNIPLNEKFLEVCLTDMTPEEWYEHLNRRVFFWVRAEKLHDLLGARAYRNREHDVITVDTQRLVERDYDHITLAPINTGAAFSPTAAKRGSDTFGPIHEYPFEARLRWRGVRNAITELAVDYKVRDIDEVALCVERCYRDTVVAKIWSRSPPDRDPPKASRR
jgi:hypothetical protein